MPEENAKYIDIKEFRESGLLQEVNRQFLHPLGLALAISVDDDGNEQLAGIWDYRDDPDGMLFVDLADEDSRVKAQWVAALAADKAITRQRLLGYVVQPIGDCIKD